MFPNAKGSELFSVLATIDPASQAVGTVTTGWISAGNHHSLLALVQSGVLGTGAKDVTGKAITQIVKVTGDNKQALINLRPDDLDVTNGYAYVRLSLTVAVAASLTAAQLLGFNPRFAPGDASNQAAVAQVV